MRNLTEQQARFVVAFTSEPGAIGNASAAARVAGYSDKSAAEIGRQLLEKPHVCTAIEEANRAQVSGTLATKAIDVLRQVIDDPDANLRIRVDAAKTILDRGGFAAAKAEAPDASRSPEKAPSEMTLEELEAYIQDGRKRLAEMDATIQPHEVN
ncbi:MAG: hypothetical protein CMM50_01205 [Rhodospirillaceae bacterium]|nr:hypothetical protein [Rhodospirillaceae bacterium]